MKFNFRKISAIATSILMTGMTAGIAAAANYPAPFVENGVADVAIVYGANDTGLDAVQAGKIQTELRTHVTGTSTTTVSGDNVLLAKSSDNLNLNDTWAVHTGTLDDTDLSTVLADGTYIADDNDDFDYEQSISLGTPRLTHFRDSDYESLVGLTEKTPVVGFKIPSNTQIMNYTLDFIQDAESSVDSKGDLDDIEGSEITMMGHTYYISDLANGSDSNYLGKMTLLDTANTATIGEGLSETVGGKTVSLKWVGTVNSEDAVSLDVGGELTGSMKVGETYKLQDGTYVGVKEIRGSNLERRMAEADISIGTGKIEITSTNDIKVNDNTIDGVKGYVNRATGTSSTVKIGSIDIRWTTEDEMFITPENSITLPGFESVKFSMTDFVRPTEEKVTIQPDGDTSMEMTVPIKDGPVSFNFLYSDSSGNFTGLGKASDERLATTNTSSLTFYEKDTNGDQKDAYFVASYAATSDAESYLLKAKVRHDSDANRNVTTISKNVNGSWLEVCIDRESGESCNIGDVSLTIGTVSYISGGVESAVIDATDSTVSFHEIYTDGGLKIYLPFEAPAGYAANGALNLTNATATAGHGWDTFYLYMDGENKDDAIGQGTEFNFTIDDTSADKLEVSAMSLSGLEVGDSTSTYEAYVVDDVAPRVLYYTNPDEDYAEVYYPTGDSESYAEVYVSEAASTSSTSGPLGDVLVLDSEVSSVSDKNLIVVGGSCINSAAATLVGGADCGDAWTAKTNVGSGQFLIRGYTDSTLTSKLALLVAGYEAADTANAVTCLTSGSCANGSPIDTSSEYKGTSATGADLMVTATA